MNIGNNYHDEYEYEYDNYLIGLLSQQLDKMMRLSARLLHPGPSSVLFLIF